MAGLVFSCFKEVVESEMRAMGKNFHLNGSQLLPMALEFNPVTYSQFLAQKAAACFALSNSRWTLESGSEVLAQPIQGFSHLRVLPVSVHFDKTFLV